MMLLLLHCNYISCSATVFFSVVNCHYSYKVIQNEHDGLITVGEVPDEAVAQAAIAAGMKYAVLEEKLFV